MLQFQNELDLEQEGCDSNATSKIISNLKANKMLSKGLGVDENLSYKEVLIEIVDRQVKRLRNKEVASVRVLWENHLEKHGRPRPI